MVQLLRYSEFVQDLQQFPTVTDELLKDSFRKDNRSDQVWLDIDLADSTAIFKIHEALGFSPVDPCSNIPVAEVNNAHAELEVTMVRWDEVQECVVSETVQLLVVDHALVSIQSGVKGDVFNKVRQRILSKSRALHRTGSDGLFVTLLETIVHHYMEILERYRLKIESIEEMVITNQSTEIIEDILLIKQQLSVIRRSLLPLREELISVRTEVPQFFSKSTLTRLRMVQDELSLVSSHFEIHREMIRNLLELHKASLSESMNQVMKTLTVVSSIFIPLTFVTGVFGMNFEFMPGIHSPVFAGSVLVGMGLFGLILFVWMKRRRWL